MSDADRVTDRAALHAEVGVPAVDSETLSFIEMAHAITVETIVYKVNCFNGNIPSATISGLSPIR